MRVALIAMLTVPAFASPVLADWIPELPAHLAIGLDDRSVLPHGPVSLDWGSDGRTYLLNAGSGTVLVFDARWSLVHEFGHPGEGPGDIARGSSILVVRDTVWVLDGPYVSTFSLEGEFLHKRAMPSGLSPVVRPIRFGDQIAAVCPSAGSVGLLLDYDLRAMASLGPECDMASSPAARARCRAWVVEPGAMESIVLIDLLSARALVIDGRTTSSWKEHALPFEKGVIEQRANGSTFWREAAATAAWDGAGGYLFALRRSEDDPRWRVLQTDADFTTKAQWALPEQVSVFDLFVSPRGEVCVLDKWDDVVYVFHVPGARKPWPRTPIAGTDSEE